MSSVPSSFGLSSTRQRVSPWKRLTSSMLRSQELGIHQVSCHPSTSLTFKTSPLEVNHEDILSLSSRTLPPEERATLMVLSVLRRSKLTRNSHAGICVSPIARSRLCSPAQCVLTSYHISPVLRLAYPVLNRLYSYLNK